ILLEAGAHKDDVDNDGLSAMMYAARDNPNPEMIRAMIGAGANAKIEDANGKTALDYIRLNPALSGSRAEQELDAHMQSF
ncbi:MAG: ankyrin repeat domain-containing protein, partial [Phycisphaerales bacterium]